MNAKQIIKMLLMNDIRLRDCDFKLLARYWTNQCNVNGIDTKEITAHKFLSLLANKQFKSPEAITRMRRKVQEENELLRGNMYNNRQTKQQNRIKAKLGYNINLSCELPKKNNKPYTIGSYDTY
tara:strand:- start:1202 stop:1573 length:372 start_codon:yes stop_codon:yes gene_type:complete